MDENGKAMVLACFVADSLALGAHWIYETESISRMFGRVDSFLEPASNSYHSKKGKGEFTHYGDQAFILLESLVEKKGFDLSDFSFRWRALFENYNGYIDQATRVTLSKYASGSTYEDEGSSSDDLAGASRMAPLIYAYRHNPEKLVECVRAQTRMTHSNPLTVDSAEFFARVTWLALDGSQPVDAIKEVSGKYFKASSISGWVEAGLGSKNQDSVTTISRFGQSCHTAAAFPGVVHLIARYENDLEEALIQSVMSGGDSAARGMIVGMVLGAHLGSQGIPQRWLSELKKREQIVDLLEKL